MLRAAYEQLGLAEGALLDATGRPTPDTAEHWVDKGEWLALGHQVGAEKIFFVDHNPVLVFAQAGTSEPDEVRRLFNRIWCMCRPQCVFIASPGELAVYNLSAPPVRPGGGLDDAQRLIERVSSVAEVQAKLHAFRREQVESGRLFEEERFGAGQLARADQALVRDLGLVRKQLIDKGQLAPQFAHALIARSVFIRYLEDRGILLPKDFEEIASSHHAWQQALATAPSRPDVDPEMNDLLYPRVLSDKDFTYALFGKLAADFNGDMFPVDAAEEQAVQPDHLAMLRGLLRGDTSPEQPSLFFFAYRFDIVPIELISSIYEAFYNTKRGRKGEHGTFYTRSTLVEFVLSSVLTPDRLAGRPRVLDPGCGSGIFLVEAFRRIVRHAVVERRRRLGLPELRAILRDQIAGIEINPEATRVAAFSLYLALLHYVDPPTIWRDKRLPNLKYDPEHDYDDDFRFNILVAGNAFAVEAKIANGDILKRFGAECADIVVGNPPWGVPSDPIGREAARVALAWCKANKKTVGYKEQSQAFIHRAQHALRPGGSAGLLVSHGVLFKEHELSRQFRQEWLSTAQLRRVVNFTHVRTIFFSGPGREGEAISPFLAIEFEKTDERDPAARFEYWSAKHTPMVDQLQAAVLSRSDLRLLPQSERALDHAFWKTYWWGNHRDDALVQAIGMSDPLVWPGKTHGRWIEDSERGFNESGGKKKPSGWLLQFSELPVRAFDRYTPLEGIGLSRPPATVVRRRQRWLYKGLRLLVKETPVERGGKHGEIAARLEEEPFAFRHSIQGFRFRDSTTWQPKVILGILWSSLARYYLFLRSSSWGLWHPKISLAELRSFPIRLPQNKALRSRITKVVDELRSLDRSSTASDVTVRERSLLRRLDEAVFRVYGLTDAERDLIRDMCDTGLDLLYDHINSDAVRSVDRSRPKTRFGTVADLPGASSRQKGLEGYLRAFLEAWNPELGEDGELRWRIVSAGDEAPLLGVVFSTQYKRSPLPPPDESDEQAWQQLLANLAKHATTPWHASRIYIDGLVRIVTDTDCVIVKRNERRLWTRSMGREDAEATLLQACLLQRDAQGAQR